MNQPQEIERIVETYSDTLLRIAMHKVSSLAEAQDIVQNVFLKYVQKAPVFQDTSHEKAWLMRVTMNAACDVNRYWWQKKRSELPDDIKQEQPLETIDLLPYIRKLSKHHCYAIYLYYYEDYSTQEIAIFFNTKESTVSSWLFRGRKELKKMLEGSVMDEKIKL